MWILRVLDRMKACLHILQTNGLSPVWRLLWSVKWPWVVKVLRQPGYLHWNGFSPEWMRMWVLRFPRSVKVLVQPAIGQTKGFSPV